MSVIPKISKRFPAIIVALVVGWVVYMIAMMMTVYDGGLSIITQPIMGAICSTLFVGAAFITGLLFRIPVLGRLWQSSRLWAVGVIVASLFFMCFGSILGLKELYVDSETGRQFTGLHSGVALSCYFALLFAITNWPFKRITVA